MKAVLDSMLWVSCLAHRHGSTYRLIERAWKARVRLFVSDYILTEVVKSLRHDLKQSNRFVSIARDAVLRRAKLVKLPTIIPAYVAGDPKDNAVVQTALPAKADYLVTADAVLLDLQKYAMSRSLT